jgi:predicted membrane metal-binding protein
MSDGFWFSFAAFFFISASVRGPMEPVTSQVPKIWPVPLLISAIRPRIFVAEPRISQVFLPSRIQVNGTSRMIKPFIGSPFARSHIRSQASRFDTFAGLGSRRHFELV